MFEKFNCLLYGLQRKLLRRPKITFTAFLFVFLAISLGSAKLQFLLSIDDLIDPDFSTYQSLKKVNHEFQDKNTILLSIERAEIFDKKFLCDLESWILSTAAERRDLITIQTSFGIRQARMQNRHMDFNSFLNVDCASPDEQKEFIFNAFTKIMTSPWQKIMATKNGYTLTVNFIVHDPKDKKFGSVDTHVVGELRKSFDAKFARVPGLKTFWGGVTTYQSYLREAFDLNFVLNSLMFLITLLLFRIFLGSWRAGLVYNASLTICLGLTYGLMGFLNIPVDILTNSTGLMIIISSLEDFVFVIFGMRNYNWSLRKSLRRFLLPAFFTTLTTAIGFGSLVTSDLSIIRRFGVISCFASFLEWGVLFLLLPPILKLWPKLEDLRFNEKLLRIRDPFQGRTPKALAWAMIVVVPLLLIFSRQFWVEDSPEDYFFKSHIVNTTSRHLLESRGWINETSLLMNTENSDEQNQSLIDQVAKLENVETVENPYQIKDYLGANLEGPEKRALFRFWEDSNFSRRLISDRGVTRAEIFISSMKMDDVKKLKFEVENICHDRCELVGSLISYNEFSVRVLNTLFSSLGLSLLLVALVIFMIRGRLKFKEIFACICASIWGPLVLLGLFMLFHIPLFFVSCICASVLVGLTGDNAIQFIFASRRQNIDQSVNSLAAASLIVTIGMISLTSVFLLSIMAPLAKLGIMMMIGFVLGYLGDVWILRGLLKK